MSLLAPKLLILSILLVLRQNRRRFVGHNVCVILVFNLVISTSQIVCGGGIFFLKLNEVYFTHYKIHLLRLYSLVVYFIV